MISVFCDMADHDRCREVERYLYRVIGISSGVIVPNAEVYNLHLSIHEAGSWLIKYRENGQIILNNCDLIMTSDSVQIDASISFVTLSSFWATVNGQIRFESGVSKTQGSERALQILKEKIFNNTSTSTSNKARIQMGIDDITNIPIKSGWLIKRGDMMHGWKRRFFKVFIGRAEYFIDPQDDVPRAVIPLLESKVSEPIEVRNRLQNRGIFYQIIIEPKYHEKSVKLISQKKEGEGLLEIREWIRVFEIACKPADKAAQILRNERVNDDWAQAGSMLAQSDGVLNASNRGSFRSSVRTNDSLKRSRAEESATYPAIFSIIMVLLARAAMLYCAIDAEEYSVVTMAVAIALVTYCGWSIGEAVYDYRLTFIRNEEVHLDSTDSFYTISTDK